MTTLRQIFTSARQFLFIPFSVFLLLACSGCDPMRTYEHQGTQRQYLFHKPANLSASAPLVIALHGYGGNARLFRFYSDLDDLADEKGFAVAYPQGVEEETGKAYWDASLELVPGADDVGFLTGLAKALQMEHGLDADRIFLFGFSNGGFMAYTLACQAPETFRAMASVLGTMSGHDWRHCQPSTPLPVLQITALDDRTVPPDGSLGVKGGWGGAPPVAQVVEFWQQQNRCSDRDQKNFPPHTRADYCRRGVAGNEVWFYTIENFGHGWPDSKDDTGIDAIAVVWEFFENAMQD